MEVENLQKLKLSLQAEINQIQTELNKTNLSIITKKNSENFVRIAHLNQNTKDLREKIAAFSGTQSKLDNLKAQVHSKESLLLSLRAKISDSQYELSSLEEALIKKQQEVSLAENRVGKLKIEIDEEKIQFSDLDESELTEGLEEKKNIVNQLTAELANLTTNKADASLLMNKSQQRILMLKEELRGLMEYYDTDLNEEMDRLIPQKQEEKKEALDELARLRTEDEEYVKEIEEANAEFSRLESMYNEKKNIIKEKLDYVKNIQEENEALRIDNEKYAKLLNDIRETKEETTVNDEMLDKIKADIWELERSLSTKENNYKNGIRSVNNRIQQTYSIINELKREIRVVLSKISNSNKKTPKKSLNTLQ